MQKKLSEIAQIISGTLIGDPECQITGVSGIEEVRKGEITFAADRKYFELAENTEAAALIVPFSINSSRKNLIQCEEPRLAFAAILTLFARSTDIVRGIHPTAITGKNCGIGKNVSLMPFVVLGDNVSVGDNTVVYPHSFIGNNSKIGSDCCIYSNVAIREDVEIGSRVIIHSGTVLGSDGFGFATVGGIHHKIPQIGTILIEADIEIGANVTIDRATTGRTTIGKGTKIDNLVHIAHYVVIGSNSMIVAQVGISGSTIVGKNVTMAGQSGAVGHLRIGDNAVIAARAGVTKNIPAGVNVSGFPAKLHSEEMRMQATLSRLPEIFKTFNKILKSLKRIASRIDKVEEKITKME